MPLFLGLSILHPKIKNKNCSFIWAGITIDSIFIFWKRAMGTQSIEAYGSTMIHAKSMTNTMETIVGPLRNLILYQGLHP
jgi:hypothetical protein